MRVVVGLGGNALLPRGERPDAEVQRRHAAVAAAAVAEIARSHRVIVTHGNGPQIGLLALQADAFAVPARPARRRDRGHDGLPARAGAGSPARPRPDRHAAHEGGRQPRGSRVRAAAPARRSSEGHQPKPSTITYLHPNEAVLRRTLEPGQYVSIRYSERLAEAGIEPSVGSVGDSYDCAGGDVPPAEFEAMYYEAGKSSAKEAGLN